ncbi:MAG: ATP:cob(I)alamin adenosyltransferase [Desulfobulbus propionicus]|nr:MAG: ATP:cob(I)alamin adenosyltransferase [Desulfobulbus propionicus]
MKVYTGGGDKGKTSLFSGERVTKYSLRIDAYGDMDELNSIIGAVIATVPEQVPFLSEQLKEIQIKLFDASAWLATTHDSSAKKFLTPFPLSIIEGLENNIDFLSDELPQLTKFIMPTGHHAAAMAHIGRTVCRRCERKVCQLVDEMTENKIEPGEVKHVQVYLNRLSDYLFVAARFINHKTGIADVVWEG